MKNGKILIYLFLTILLGIFISTGCGSSTLEEGDNGGGETETTDTTAPTIAYIKDANSAAISASGTTGVESSSFSIEFSEDMDESTISTTTITLTNASTGVDVAGTVSYTDKVVTFTPSSYLDLITAYTLTIASTVEDASDNQLGSDATYNFTTRDGSWLTTKNVSEPLGSGLTSAGARHAMNAGTNGMIVWSTGPSGGGANTIYARYFTASTLSASSSWGDVTAIESGSGHATGPGVSMDDNGIAIAVWSQNDGSAFKSYANRFGGSSWGSETIFDAASTVAVDVAMDSSGNAIAASGAVNAAYYTASSTSWGAASSVGNLVSPQLAMNAGGTAMIAGRFLNEGTYTDVAVSRYSSGSWSSLTSIDSATGVTDDPQVAVDPNGKAIAVWLQSDGTRNNVWANIFNGSSWGTAGLLETGSGDADEPQVAFADDGTAIVVWKQSDGSVNNVYAQHYDGSGWGGAVQISDGVYNADDPQVAVDKNGNAIAVWSQDEGTDPIYAARYVAATDTWGDPEQIDDGGYDAATPYIAIDGYGAAIAVWLEGPANNKSVTANRFQ